MEDQDRLEGIETESEGPVGSDQDGEKGSDDTPLSEGGAPEGLAEKVAALKEALDSLNDRHLRLAAEFDNYRKRSQAQLGESRVRAQASLVGSLLDALDDFGRVTSIDPETATVESVLEGVALVERKLYQLLQDAGLEEIDPEGEPFDPNVMEAMVRMPAASEEEDDTVEQVFQRGFRFGGHLVRPARVSVRKFE